MSRHRFDNEEFEIAGDRPYVTADRVPPKFHLDDDYIYVFAPGGAREGPYKIASVDNTSKPAKYTLSLANGTLVDNGVLFEETRLTQQK